MHNDRAFWVSEAEAYLAECREKASSVRASELALRLERTPAQLAREFHVSVGARLKDYLCSRQIERAKELLRTTRRTTAEIALDSGFGTPRSFYRAFRRSVGVTPTEYRKEMSLATPDFRQ